MLNAVPFLLSILVPLLLCVPPWLIARQSGRWFHWDWASLIIPIVLWSLLLCLGIGAQSLSNIVEIYIVIGAVIVAYYLRIFVADRFFTDFRRNSATAFFVCCFLVVSLRLLMPNLPE